jgi:hypothetical protein
MHGHPVHITHAASVLEPWELYLKARARKSPPALQVEHEDDQEPEHVRSIRAMARSELRLAEIVCWSNYTQSYNPLLTILLDLPQPVPPNTNPRRILIALWCYVTRGR